MDSKQQIITTAESLFLRYGIKSITMDDVSRELGISKKTLYQFVDNKRDLIEEVMEHTISNEKKMMQDIREQSSNAIDEMLAVARHVTQLMRQLHPGAMYDLQKYYRDCWRKMEAFHQEYIYAMIKENIEKGQREELYRSDLDADIVAKLYVGKTIAIVDESAFPLNKYNRENLFREYIFYHLRGIASSKGLKLLEKHRQ